MLGINLCSFLPCFQLAFLLACGALRSGSSGSEPRLVTARDVRVHVVACVSASRGMTRRAGWRTRLTDHGAHAGGRLTDHGAHAGGQIVPCLSLSFVGFTIYKR